MKNTIATRIYDFLKNYPPFQFLAKKDLKYICTQAVVKYVEKGEPIFKVNDPYAAYFYVVQQGAVRLVRQDGQTQKIVDMCDEGDLFGLQVITKENRHRFTATANEETIVYGIPMDDFYAFAKANKAISNYLIATFASKVKDPYSLEHNNDLFTTYKVDRNAEIASMQPARYSTNIVKSKSTDSIQSVAQHMKTQNVGSVVITENNLPTGIITSKELTSYLASGVYSTLDRAHSIMQTPVICHDKNLTVAQAQLILLRNEISHLVITNDGTAKSPIQGVLSKQDLMVSMANNPTQLIKALKRAKKTKELRHIWQKGQQLLKRLLDQELPLGHILQIFTELQSALVTRVIELSVLKIGETPPVSFAWLALGSQGRNEQLLLTDQDNALIFNNVDSANYDFTKSYFLKLSNRINKRLHKIGFDYCPADMMASNPLYCLSISEWEEQFNVWMHSASPEHILKSGIFFDFNCLYGDIVLAQTLNNSILSRVSRSTVFIRHMAKDALKSPIPVGFFRNFIVEQSGEHKNEFNIKARAIAPLVDAARVLALHYQLESLPSTIARYKALSQHDLNNRELYDSCAYAFKALLKFRVKQGLKHQTAGRYINLQELTKAEKLKLKRCFKPLRDIQELIKIRFQTQFVYR